MKFHPPKISIFALWGIPIFTASLFITSCEKNNDPKSDPPSDSTAQTISHDGETREYIVYVPDSYDGNSDFPLLLNFHGFGGQASKYLEYADMRGVADAKNFILVYPQGTELDGFSHWNAALPSPTNKSDADDLGFAEVLVDQLSNDYAIDSERIYACGFSNGGMFSYALACYKSDWIAAVASVSGAMLDTSGSCAPSRPMPVVSIHGTLDNVIPYGGNSDYHSVETVLDFWKTHNHTADTAQLTTANHNGLTIEHYQYAGGDSGVSVAHYKIIGGGHDWFDLDFQGANTGELIWDFVSRYDLDGAR